MTGSEFSCWYLCGTCKCVIKNYAKYIVHALSHGYTISSTRSQVKEEEPYLPLSSIPENYSSKILVPKIYIRPLEDLVDLDDKDVIRIPQCFVALHDLVQIPKQIKQELPINDKNEESGTKEGNADSPLTLKTGQIQVNQRKTIIIIGRDGRSRKIVRCNSCNRTIRADDLKKHLVRCQNPADLSCKYYRCSTRFKTTAQLNDHICNVHLGQGLHKCKKCPYTHNDAKKFEKHTIRCNRPKKSKSEEPTPRLVVAKEFVEHVFQNEPFKCEHCPRSFRDGSLLKRHMERCKKQTGPVFPCLYSCPAQFKTNDALLFHVALFHKYELMHKCKLCKKPFATTFSLNRHLIRTCRPKLKLHEQQTRRQHSRKY